LPAEGPFERRVELIPWTLELLLPAGERLPEGVEVGVCTECSNVSVYAALHAAGCPRLAFLLTDLDPRDPLDEELASWKLWLVRAEKRAKGAAGRKRAMELREWYEGFLVPTDYLYELDDGEVKKLKRRALKGDLYAAAQLAVNAEMERFVRMAEAGFPDALRIFDRFVDVRCQLGYSYSFAIAENRFPPEKLKEWEEMGVGARERWGSMRWFEVRLRCSDQVPEELKREGAEDLLSLLRSLAELLVPIRKFELDGYLLAMEG
jgi:hypothetical protein